MKTRFSTALEESVLPHELLHIITLTQEVSVRLLIPYSLCQEVHILLRHS